MGTRLRGGQEREEQGREGMRGGEAQEWALAAGVRRTLPVGVGAGRKANAGAPAADGEGGLGEGAERRPDPGPLLNAVGGPAAGEVWGVQARQCFVRGTWAPAGRTSVGAQSRAGSGHLHASCPQVSQQLIHRPGLQSSGHRP